ncbi:hypothetical protein [Bifidobacterium margollesii]|nr:hypothetical protein [Bifidobacterium margollesii]
MATDLGLVQIRDESDEKFAARTVYSALRFWMQAFCLDDGYGGIYGIDRRTVERKSTAWLETLSSPYPTIRQWFGNNDRHIVRRILSLMVTSRNLMVTDEGMYRCVIAHTERITEDCEMLSGLVDPTESERITADNRRQLPFSGLTAAVSRQIPDASPRLWVGNNADADDDIPQAQIKSLDNHHCLLIIDTVPPANLASARLINMLSWPRYSVDDALHRVFRHEYRNIILNALQHDIVTIYDDM